jgi:energy-coupling factor transporter ATP-binding protein EcfA2
MAKINPFDPNSPVHAGMFVGRVPELIRLESCLVQTKAGSPSNFMLTGERGIGKSSLLNYIKSIAEGEEGIKDTKVSFLAVDTDIDSNTTQLGLVEKIKLGLDKALGRSEAGVAFLKQTWEFLKRVEGGGFKLRAGEQMASDERLLEEFAYSLASVAERVCSEGESSPFGARFDGILILVDEADNAAPELSLGSFFKLLTERLRRRGCGHVAFGIAGLPELRNVLATSHPSSLRLFEELVLGRLSMDEARRVIDMGLRRANRANQEQTTITEEARGRLAYYSEGYPHFIQQFAHSAFAVDEDNIIDDNDVAKGGFGRRGAMELIGDRYYRDSYYTKIQKESYRQVLRIMADKLDDWVTKKEIKQKFKGPESTLDNALFALRDRQIILAKEGERGVYRLQHKGFAWWIKLYTTDSATLQQSLPNVTAPGRG